MTNDCSSRVVPRNFSRSVLPASVVDELELNIVIPPPDTNAYEIKHIIEEDTHRINTL